MKFRRAAIAASALVALFTFAQAALAQDAPRTRPAPQVSEGMEAPDFNVESIDGKRIWLAEYRGKLVLLIFWSTG